MPPKYHTNQSATPHIRPTPPPPTPPPPPAPPPLENETPAFNVRRQEVARAMVAAAHPADPIEAALAISAAVAYQASIASTALAASPGLTSLPSNRYARTAIAQDRAFHAG